jgi:hypothetical protein
VTNPRELRGALRQFVWRNEAASFCWLLEGMQNKEIADGLGLAPRIAAHAVPEYRTNRGPAAGTIKAWLVSNAVCEPPT